MKKLLKILVLTVMIFQFVPLLKAQQAPPFYNEIQQFKKEDSAHFPPQNIILFVGSSSFQKWHDVQNYFPDKPIINRGFGGSELTDVIRYANDIIIPYHPKQIVIYAGENDLAYSDTVSAKTVADRLVALFKIIRKSLPNVPVVFVSIKPSPSREKFMPKIVEANRLIKQFLQSKKKAVFIDVYNKMLDANGKPMQDIFVEDNLHMNTKGYHIWQKAMAPYLIK